MYLKSIAIDYWCLRHLILRSHHVCPRVHILQEFSSPIFRCIIHSHGHKTSSKNTPKIPLQRSTEVMKRYIQIFKLRLSYTFTPHAFYRKSCLDAIKGGKQILCEKVFTITEKEAREVFVAAEEKEVFVMEALRT